MNNQKEQERAELHKTIWNIANDLRGSVDGWDFKSYVLGFLFYRYISENFENYVNKQEGSAKKKNSKKNLYSSFTDNKAETRKDLLIENKGFFIAPSHLFINVLKNAKNDKNLNETLQKIFHAIEESSQGTPSYKKFQGLFSDIDLNSSKLGSSVDSRNEKIVKIMDKIGNLKLGDYQDNTIEIFGDTYEYLMAMYASSAGKSGGEFFTPQEVSELLARLAIADRSEINSVYDPACGSGSLLLQAAKILGKDQIKDGFFGQEINLTTYNLCRINMFLHDIGFDKFDIACDDTLIKPYHLDNEPFEVIVSNPPYSIKWAGKDNPILSRDERFIQAGILAPKGKADFAFVMHSLHLLATNGVAAIVCFPGILYRGGAEQKIRKYLIDNNYIHSIIQLPDNLFFGTSIATAIMVLKKSKSDNSVLFVDASKYYVKATKSNKLSRQNIADILQIYTDRIDVDRTSILVPKETIEQNGYNLSTSTYISKEDTSEKIDIKVLNQHIKDIVAKEESLRKAIDNIIKDIEG